MTAKTKVTAQEKRDAKKTFDALAKRGQQSSWQAGDVEVRITRGDGTVETFSGYLTESTITHDGRAQETRATFEMVVRGQERTR